MVAVGSGVSVNGMEVGVAMIASNEAQEAMNDVAARRHRAAKHFLHHDREIIKYIMLVL